MHRMHTPHAYTSSPEKCYAKAMRQEILRLTGKPVLEVVEVYRQTVLKRYLCMLPTGVYIEPQGLREGDDVDNPLEDTTDGLVH